MRRFVVGAIIGLALVVVGAVAVLDARNATRIRQDVWAEFVVQPGETATFAPGDVLPGDVVTCREHGLHVVVPQPGFAEIVDDEASVTTLSDGFIVAQCPSGSFSRGL